MSDAIQDRAAKRDAKKRQNRLRLCFTCAKPLPEGEVLGLVHSELACQGCGATPCHGIVTRGDAPKLKGEPNV